MSGTSKGIVFGIILFIVGGGSVALSNSLTYDFVHSAEDFHNSGASVDILKTSKQIDPVICNGLGEIDGVNGAGAVKLNADTITPVTLPQGTIPEANVTENFADLLDFRTLDKSVAGVYIPTLLAERLGVSAGDSFASDNGNITIRGVYNYPDDGRQSGIGYAILNPTETNANELYDECWLDIWPQNANLEAFIWQSKVADDAQNNGNQQVKLQQLNGKYGESFNGQGIFESSVIKYLPYFTLLIAFALGFLACRLRRLEIASALHAGVKKVNILAQFLFESLAPVLILWLLSISVFLATIYTANPYDKGTLLLNALRVLLTTSVGFVVGITIAVLLTFERHLFKYFKGR